MFESIFNEIAEEYGCDYYINDIKVNATLGSKMPITKHHLNIDYNGVTFKLLYELGNYNLAETSFNIKNTRFPIPAFQVDTRDRIVRFFTSNKSIWKIKSKDSKLKFDLNEILNTSTLTALANKEAFDPMIKGYSDDSGFHLYTRYSLAFNNKETSIKPVIEFHKNLIDYLTRVYV